MDLLPKEKENISTKPVQIPVEGSTLCVDHQHLIMTEVADNLFATCDYISQAKAIRVARELRRRFAYPVNSTVRVVSGPCPVFGRAVAVEGETRKGAEATS